MTRSPLSILSLAACLMLGCASVGPIEVSGDPAALPPFKTFRIHEEQFVFATDISAEERARVGSQLRQAAVTALNGRGYVEASDADMLVSLGAISRPVLNTENGPASDGGLRPVDTSVFDPGRSSTSTGTEPMPPGVGREGDLILHLIDPKTQRAVWRASANGAATTPSEALRRARATYAEMVAKLPKAAGS